MLFKRRKPLSVIEIIKSALVPKTGYKRALSYIFKRITRISASPHAISAGMAAGVLASFTPFLGFHLIIAVLIAIIIGGNYLVAGFSTLVGNPITFPFIWTLNYKIGVMLVNGKSNMLALKASPPKSSKLIKESNLFLDGFDNLWSMITGDIGWPLLIGSIPCGIVAGLVVYLITFVAVKLYRKSNIHRRRLERKEMADSEFPNSSKTNPSE